MKHQPRNVTVASVNGVPRLVVDDVPYFVKGAGGAYHQAANLASHGANSLRTWSTTDAQRILDGAHAAGVSVLMGLDVARERHGFDYDDPAAVGAQLDRLEGEVRAFKDHPALLGWGIGNELNLHSENPAVWNAVDGIAAMIHSVDGSHPATTMLAGINVPDVHAVAERASRLDFLSFQMYGGVGRAKELVAAAAYDGPYLITEWGATGHWEVPLTAWGAPIEQTSSEKADAILERYRAAVLGDSAHCMGSYVFLWGQKQERTPTWYGLLTEEGRETEAIDVMHFLWTDAWPTVCAPRLTDIRVGGKGRYDSVVLKRSESALATIAADPPPTDAQARGPATAARDDISVRAEILPEATVLGEGGDFEPRPQALPGLIGTATRESVDFTAPREPGAYRLFVYLLDGHNHAATANLPFRVE